MAAPSRYSHPIFHSLLCRVYARPCVLPFHHSMKAIKLLTEKPIEGLEGTFTITNLHGLHARPSATLVKVAKEFQSEIWVANLDGDGKSVNAKSLMKIVSLGVKSGHRLQFIAKGDDAQQAISKIGQSIADGLGEGAGHE